MANVSTKEVDNLIAELQNSGEEYKLISGKAQRTKRALAMVGSDNSGVWNLWALVPAKTPKWLWDMVRKGFGSPMDDWDLSFINDALNIIGADVRFDANGKPTSQLLYYRTQLQSYTDDERLMKWSNSTPGRGLLVSTEMQTGNISLLAAAREAYYGQRLLIFTKIFIGVYNADVNEDEAPIVPVYDDKVMSNSYHNLAEDVD